MAKKNFQMDEVAALLTHEGYSREDDLIGHIHGFERFDSESSSSHYQEEAREYLLATLPQGAKIREMLVDFDQAALALDQALKAQSKRWEDLFPKQNRKHDQAILNADALHEQLFVTSMQAGDKTQEERARFKLKLRELLGDEIEIGQIGDEVRVGESAAPPNTVGNSVHVKAGVAPPPKGTGRVIGGAESDDK